MSWFYFDHSNLVNLMIPESYQNHRLDYCLYNRRFPVDEQITMISSVICVRTTSSQSISNWLRSAMQNALKIFLSQMQ